MAIHYSASAETIACGRTGASLETTQDVAQVSCKLCLRAVEKAASEPARKTPSLAELRAAAKAAKAAAAEAEAQALAAQATPRLSPRAEWQQRLAQMPGRNRLPRGAAKKAAR
ncbi:MAG: hypothetical protein AAGC84_00905 [Pseudomonas sp.]